MNGPALNPSHAPGAAARPRWWTLPRGGLRAQQGSILLESALILPAFLLSVFGFFEFSFALAAYMNVTYATRVAARYASLHSLSSAAPATEAQVKQLVLDNLFIPGATSALGSGNVLVLYGNRNPASPAAAGNYQGDLVGVGIFWQQTVNIPFYGSNTFYMSTQAYRVIER
jgi:Flp pilus assembly protein TadG